MTGIVAGRAFHRAQHLEPEAGAVLEAAAIFVGAAVLERRVELRDEIAVRGVQLDAVEPGFPRARRGGGKGGDGLGDARLGHFPRHDRRIGDLVDRVRDGRGRNRVLAANVAPRVAAGVAQLDRRLGARRMDRRREARKAGQETVVVDAELGETVPAAALRRRHLAGDEPDAALGARDVIGDLVVGDEPVLVGKPRRHRRHDDAVPDFDAADLRGREKDVHAPFASAMRRQIFGGDSGSELGSTA